MKLWLVKHQGYYDIEELWQEYILGIFESENDAYEFLNTSFNALAQVFLDIRTITIQEIETNMGYNGFLLKHMKK